MSNKCKERGFHSWPDETIATDEDFDNMTVTITCKDCNATWEGSGEWSE